MPLIPRFSLFWRFCAYFWLALILVIGITFAVTKAINQNALVKAFHPALKNIPQDFFSFYHQNPHDAFSFLQKKRQERIFIQILDEDGNLLLSNFHDVDKKEKRHKRLKVKQFSQEFSYQNENFLFIYLLPKSEVKDWHKQNFMWLWITIILLVGLIILTLISFVLSFSITNPLHKLRLAVQDLAHNNYDQQNLTKLFKRSDELGILAQDFNVMGNRLQKLIHAQRQLLRDVSHELRSPLARLKIASALIFNADDKERYKLQHQVELECSRLDELIDEILTLSRLEEAKKLPTKECNLLQLLQNLIFDANVTHPQQEFDLVCANIYLHTDQNLLERALNNLITNAVKFNAPNKPIKISVTPQNKHLIIKIRDYGFGVNNEDLPKLGQTFWRANPQIKGNGLGLAIAQRAIANLGGNLTFTNHVNGGFVAQIELNL